MTENNHSSKSDEEWKKKLSPEQFEICRKKATEPPFSGGYYNCKEKGIYQCVCCGNNLFSSNTKYDSGTGWPSFWDSIKKENVKTASDSSCGVTRIEVMCSKCNSHLGHVFDDGPSPTNQRFCINSASLKLKKTDV